MLEESTQACTGCHDPQHRIDFAKLRTTMLEIADTVEKMGLPDTAGELRRNVDAAFEKLAG